jgi:hypothetical protein
VAISNGLRHQGHLRDHLPASRLYHPAGKSEMETETVAVATEAAHRGEDIDLPLFFSFNYWSGLQ